MCYFLTVAVPVRHAHRIGEVFGRGFQTRATANPSIIVALPAGYTPCVVTSGDCSCDLYAKPTSPAALDPTVHLRRKYEKLGWSAAKIQRALDQAAASSAKLNRPTSGVRDDVTDCLGALCRAAGSVALLVHWYSGDLETERLTLHRAPPCESSALRSRAQHLAEDEILIAIMG